MKKHKPGDLIRSRSRPRHRGEILCHNHVHHHEDTPHGSNGFRYFIVARGGGWKLCPCGWRPELGRHYAIPDHVKFQREFLGLEGERKKRRALAHAEAIEQQTIPLVTAGVLIDPRSQKRKRVKGKRR